MPAPSMFFAAGSTGIPASAFSSTGHTMKQGFYGLHLSKTPLTPPCDSQ